MRKEKIRNAFNRRKKSGRLVLSVIKVLSELNSIYSRPMMSYTYYEVIRTTLYSYT